MEPIPVDPFRCRVWNLHNRLEEHIDEESCKAEIRSFMEYGQLIPVLGRKIEDEADYDIELIYGARRLFVARHLKKPLLIEVRSLSNREALVAMDIENRQRVDVSPYERALSYARWLRSGVFSSQEDLARALKVSPSHVSHLLKLARLPSIVASAFATATDICEGWGLDLADLLDDPERRAFALRAARSLAALSPPLPVERLSADGLNQIERALRRILEEPEGSAVHRISACNLHIATAQPNEHNSLAR